MAKEKGLPASATPKALQAGIFPPQRDHARGVTTLVGIIIIVAVAVVAFGGVFGYQYLAEKFEAQNPIELTGSPRSVQSETNPNDQNPNSQNVVGGDRDAHGCIGSAGYSWCEAKQKCLRTWEETCVDDQTAGWKTYINNSAGYEIKYPTDWEKEELIQNVRFLFSAPNQNSATVKNGVEVTVEYVDYDYEMYVKVLDAQSGMIGTSTNAVLGGIPARKLIYNVGKIKKTQLGTVKNNKRYVIIFQADIDSLSQLSSIGEKIINTFKFTK